MKEKVLANPCIICGHQTTTIKKTYRKPALNRSYQRCSHCDFIAMDKQFHLCATDERCVYQDHNNRIDDPVYIAYCDILPPLEEVGASRSSSLTAAA